MLHNDRVQPVRKVRHTQSRRKGQVQIVTVEELMLRLKRILDTLPLEYVFLGATDHTHVAQFQGIHFAF